MSQPLTKPQPPPPPPPSKPSILKTITLSLTKYSLIVILFILMSIPLVYIVANEKLQATSDHPLYVVFQNEEYKEIKSNLNKNKRSLLFGKNKEEIEHLVDHYAHTKSKSFKIIKWSPMFDFDINKHFPLNYIKQIVEEYANWEADGPAIWIIQLNKQNYIISEIQRLTSLYPEDTFILISDYKIKIPKFKIFQMPDLNQKIFYNKLAKKLKISDQSAQIITKYFGSIAQTIQNTNPNKFDLNNILKNNFRQWNKQHTQPIKKKFQKLCNDGKIKENKQIKAMDTMGAFYTNGFYYWRNPQSLLNYQILTQTTDCKQFTIVDTFQSKDNQSQKPSKKKQQKPIKPLKPLKPTKTKQQEPIKPPKTTKTKQQEPIKSPKTTKTKQQEPIKPPKTTKTKQQEPIKPPKITKTKQQEPIKPPKTTKTKQQKPIKPSKTTKKQGNKKNQNNQNKKGNSNDIKAVEDKPNQIHKQKEQEGNNKVQSIVQPPNVIVVDIVNQTGVVNETVVNQNNIQKPQKVQIGENSVDEVQDNGEDSFQPQITQKSQINDFTEQFNTPQQKEPEFIIQNLATDANSINQGDNFVL